MSTRFILKSESKLCKEWTTNSAWPAHTKISDYAAHDLIYLDNPVLTI